MSYQIHTPETAPEGAREILTGARANFGFVPNLLGMMATAPALLKAYTTLSRIFEESSFTATERQVVLLTVSYENGCEYCVAAHSVIAGMQKVPTAIIEAIRSHTPIAEPKLEALRQFTAKVVRSRGWPAQDDLRALNDVGYGPQQVLEVILGVGLKTISNYANHIAETPLDTAFAKAAWAKAA